MTSRRAIGTVWFRAARAAIEEGHISLLQSASALGGGCDGASCRQSRQTATCTRPEAWPSAGSSFCGCSHLCSQSQSSSSSVAAATVTKNIVELHPTSWLRHLIGPRLMTSASVSPFGGAPRAASVAHHGFATLAAAVPTSVEDASLLSLRAQLADSLALCLGIQQLDALLVRNENRLAMDEMLLLTALDVAYRLCDSVSSAVPPAPTSALAIAAEVKSSAQSASDVLTRLSEVLIQRLSEPGALSPEGAVSALRTLAILKFNPAGDYAGLQTMAAFYREAILPQLDPENRNLSPERAARVPQQLAELFFAFSKLFEVAASREKELQIQLATTQIAEEEAFKEEDGEGGKGGEAALPPWERSGAGAAAAQGPMVLGDRQLYSQLCKMLSGPGMLSNVPSKTLGTLATALATARFTHFPLAQSIATQTLLRLQGIGLAAGGAAGVRLPDAQPMANDALASSTLSNILNCLARLGFEHEALCDAVANWMLQRLKGSSNAVVATAGGSSDGTFGTRAGFGSHGIKPHHLVDIAVAFVRIKYENMDFLLSASEVLQLKLSQANPQSVAMMTWAIANTKSGRAPEFEGVLAALAQRMVALRRYSSEGAAGRGRGSRAVLPRHLTCTLSSFARLGHKHVRLMDAVATDVVARADKYQVRQLVSVLRAFTMLNEYVPNMYDMACAVLTSRLRALAAQSEATLPPPPESLFVVSHYADLAWAVAMAGHAPRATELMNLLADRLVEVAPQMGKASLVRAAQAYAIACSSNTRLMDALAQASHTLLVDLGPDYLAALVGAFAQGQHSVSEEFWLACMDATGLKVPQLMQSRSDMQLATWRLQDAFNRHPASQMFPACRNHYVLPLLHDLVESNQKALTQQ